MGEGAGEKKLEAIEKNKTPTIDEDGLLDMIRNAAGKKSKYDEAASSSTVSKGLKVLS